MSLAKALRIVALTVYTSRKNERERLRDTYKVLDLVLTGIQDQTHSKDLLVLWDVRAKLGVMLAIMESPQDFTNPKELMRKKSEEVLAILGF